MDKWLSKLESSNWLTHVKDVLTCSCVAAQCVDKEGRYSFNLEMIPRICMNFRKLSLLRVWHQSLTCTDIVCNLFVIRCISISTRSRWYRFHSTGDIHRATFIGSRLQDSSRVILAFDIIIWELRNLFLPCIDTWRAFSLPLKTSRFSGDRGFWWTPAN